MNEYNSKEKITKWMKNCLTKAKPNLSYTEKYTLFKEGKRILELGCLRGDISERWKQLGYGSDKIPDLYL